jgi:zinc transport system substrate-binding protein
MQIYLYTMDLEMESWKDKVLDSVDNKNLIVVNTSDGTNAIKNTDSGEIKEHGQYDPHVWLGLKEAKVQIKNIKDALIKADPSNKTFYEKITLIFQNRLMIFIMSIVKNLIQ